MTVSRVVLLAAVVTAIPLPAMAQFGGMPLPGTPGTAPGGMPGGGMSGMPSGGFSRAQPPPACQDLLNLRDETQKRAGAINTASQKKASAAEACKLFKAFLTTESKMIKSIEEHAQLCGLPPELLKQVKGGHTKAQQVGDQVCEAAARGDRPAGPSLSEALGVTASVPGGDGKKGGAFDTLTGNALTR